MRKKDNLLIIFTKNPELGKVKTRLAKDVGNAIALKIYRFLLQHTYSLTKNLNVAKEVHFSHKIEEDLWDENFRKVVQQGSSLGERMEFAFKKGFKKDYKNIIIIGSDLYDINLEHLQQAFQELETHDYVLGPAEDGGYYLLGMKSLNSNLFRNKKWSTDSVLKDSLKDIKNKKVKLLETRNDIDEFKDIKDHPDFRQFLKNKNDKKN